MDESRRDRDLRNAKADAVQKLIDLARAGGDVKDPAKFVKNSALASVPDVDSRADAGEAGEAVVEAVIKELIKSGHLDSYEKTKKGEEADRRGIDFFVVPSVQRYPNLDVVEIDAAFNNGVLVDKIEELRRWLERMKMNDDAEIYLLREGRVILSADNADRPIQTLIDHLKKMEEFKGRRR